MPERLLGPGDGAKNVNGPPKLKWWERKFLKWYEKIAGPEPEPKSKKITVLNLPHEGLFTVDIVGAHIRHNIASMHKWYGRSVAVFVEESTGTEKLSAEVRRLTTEGVLPTDAMRIAYAADTQAAEVAAAAAQSKGEEIADLQNTFTEAFYGMLDKIAGDHKRHLVVVTEAHKPELMARTPELIDALTFVGQPLPDDAGPEYYDAYRAAIATIAEIQDARDEDDADQIAALVEDPEIGSVVKLNGSAHRVGGKLAARGYNAETIHEGNTPDPHPIIALVYHHLDAPDTPITDEHIELTQRVFDEIPLFGGGKDGFEGRRLKWIEDQLAARQAAREAEGQGEQEQQGQSELAVQTTEVRVYVAEGAEAQDATDVFDTADAAAGFDRPEEPPLAERKEARASQDPPTRKRHAK